MADNLEDAKELVRENLNEQKIQDYTEELEAHEDVDRMIETVGPKYNTDYVLSLHLRTDNKHKTKILGVIDEEVREPEAKHLNAFESRYENVEIDYLDFFDGEQKERAMKHLSYI